MSDNNIKDIPEQLKKHYFDLLDYLKVEYRNGYFYRDICEKKKAYKTIEISMILIILTE